MYKLGGDILSEGTKHIKICRGGISKGKKMVICCFIPLAPTTDTLYFARKLRWDVPGISNVISHRCIRTRIAEYDCVRPGEVLVQEAATLLYACCFLEGSRGVSCSLFKDGGGVFSKEFRLCCFFFVTATTKFGNDDESFP